MYRQVRGMKDFFGETAEQYEYIIEKSRKIANLHGFSLIETPILEYTEVFARGLGDESDVVSKEMYSFDDKGGESVTMRPEGTAGTMRAIVTGNLGSVMPVKLMYYGPMFRYDRPQKGRYRQFHQVGFEYIGDKSPITDALIILISSDILHEVGVHDFEIRINTLGDDETREDYTKAIVRYFSRHVDNLSEDSQRRLRTNPLRILDSKNEKDREIASMAPLLRDYITKEAGVYFSKVCNILETQGINFTLDDFLVRGLDYYSHTAFEIKTTGAAIKDSIGGGGRYDKLLHNFGGPSVSGMGFALGVERVMSCMQPRINSYMKIAVISVSSNEDMDAFEIMRNLQDHNIPAELIQANTVQKKLKIADRIESRIAVIIGETEKENKSLTLKFLRNQTEKKTMNIKRQNLIRFLANYHNN